jgi:hypothetical protein
LIANSEQISSHKFVSLPTVITGMVKNTMEDNLEQNRLLNAKPTVYILHQYLKYKKIK